VGQITFDRIGDITPFTQSQKKELLDIVMSSLLDWIFTKSKSTGFVSMAEYVSSYHDENGPVILQAFSSTPGHSTTSDGELIEIGFDDATFEIFKQRVKSLKLAIEDTHKFCQYCRISHSPLFNRYKYCLRDMELKQPAQLGSGKVQ
jgi:hypothetical protein